MVQPIQAKEVLELKSLLSSLSNRKTVMPVSPTTILKNKGIKRAVNQGILRPDLGNVDQMGPFVFDPVIGLARSEDLPKATLAPAPRATSSDTFNFACPASTQSAVHAVTVEETVSIASPRSPSQAIQDLICSHLMRKCPVIYLAMTTAVDSNAMVLSLFADEKPKAFWTGKVTSEFFRDNESCFYRDGLLKLVFDVRRHREQFHPEEKLVLDLQVVFEFISGRDKGTLADVLAELRVPTVGLTARGLHTSIKQRFTDAQITALIDASIARLHTKVPLKIYGSDYTLRNDYMAVLLQVNKVDPFSLFDAYESAGKQASVTKLNEDDDGLNGRLDGSGSDSDTSTDTDSGSDSESDSASTSDSDSESDSASNSDSNSDSSSESKSNTSSHSATLADSGKGTSVDNGLLGVERILPSKITQVIQKFDELSLQNDIVIDVALDEGRPPVLNILGKGMVPLDASTVTSEDIQTVLGNLGGENAFGNDNRAVIANSNHRVSALRDRGGDIFGFTIRIARDLTNPAAAMILDLLADPNNSLLIVGHPGAGKTSFIRGICQFITKQQNRNAFIIDTSNEIAGNGHVPLHVGHCRRMMVKHRDQQGAVMIECVQNHTVEDLIIDEIGRTTEVKSAQIVSHRGVRLFASAHGSFTSVMQDPILMELLGGVVNVTLGDQLAKATNKSRKMTQQRKQTPVFQTVIELKGKGNFDTIRVIRNPGDCIDRVLYGESVQVERRTFDKSFGGIIVQDEAI